MVLVFLRAELGSPHYEAHVATVLSRLRTTSAVIEHGDLGNEDENELRSKVLGGYRGYPNGALFTRFPTDVEWSRVALSVDEIRELRYVRQGPTETWERLSGQSLMVRDGVEGVRKNVVDDPVNSRIRALALEIGSGNYPEAEMILVAEHALAQHIILEGHTRATGYALANSPIEEVEAIVGYSKGLPHWRFY
jgi:hypothetical protein